MNLDMTRQFVYRNARPLDIMRWRYHFEGGSRYDALTALAAYQNADGGFGHALEADCWNPGSSPMQTRCAIEVLREVGLCDSDHPIITGILRYLFSGSDFDGHMWLNFVPSNNDYPHAPWWTYDESAPSPRGYYNPAACFAGFILRYARPDSDVYALGRRVAKEAFDAYMANELTDDTGIAQCYQRLYQYCSESAQEPPFDMAALKARVREHIRLCLTWESSEWSGYACRPSQFIDGPDSPWYDCCADLAEYEREFINDTQQADGSWPIPWGWNGYPAEWAISRLWWQGDMAVRNALYLRAFAK